MTLEAFRDAVNAGKTYAGYTVKLLDDIDLGGIEWEAAKTFSGIFDGQNHTIRNFKVVATEDYAGGLFNELSNATLKNLTVNAEVIAKDKAGLVVGKTIGTTSIMNVISRGKITQLTGDGGIGGLVGHINDETTILNCSNYASIISNEYRAGGLVAQVRTGASLIMQNCFNYGEIEGANTGTNPIGWAGMVGVLYAGNATILNCGNYGNTNGGGQLTGYVFGNSSLVFSDFKYGEEENPTNVENLTLQVNNLNASEYSKLIISYKNGGNIMISHIQDPKGSINGIKIGYESEAIVLSGLSFASSDAPVYQKWENNTLSDAPAKINYKAVYTHDDNNITFFYEDDPTSGTIGENGFSSSVYTLTLYKWENNGWSRMKDYSFNTSTSSWNENKYMIEATNYNSGDERYVVIRYYFDNFDNFNKPSYISSTTEVKLYKWNNNTYQWEESSEKTWNSSTLVFE